MYHYFINEELTELEKEIHQMLLEINLIKMNNGKYRKNNEIKDKEQNNKTKNEK
jgi:hypothetical protein